MGDPLALTVPGEPLQVGGGLVTFLTMKGRSLRRAPRDTAHLHRVEATPWGGDVGATSVFREEKEALG